MLFGSFERTNTKEVSPWPLLSFVKVIQSLLNRSTGCVGKNDSEGGNALVNSVDYNTVGALLYSAIHEDFHLRRIGDAALRRQHTIDFIKDM